MPLHLRRSSEVDGFTAVEHLDANMDAFARAWPDTLSGDAAARDLGYAPEVGLEEMVARVLAAHSERRAQAQAQRPACITNAGLPYVVAAASISQQQARLSV